MLAILTRQWIIAAALAWISLECAKENPQDAVVLKPSDEADPSKAPGKVDALFNGAPEWAKDQVTTPPTPGSISS